MSSSAAGGSGAPGEEGKKGSLAKRFLKRARTVFRTSSSKRASMVGPSTTTAGPSEKAAPAPSTPAPALAPVEETSKGAAAMRFAVPSVKPETATPIRPKSGKTAAENSKIQEDKARAIFAKYNMTLEIGEWTPPFRGDTVRVEKKIRMRIHRVCHRCRTTFGAERLCNHCQHTRCKKCPWFPTPAGLKDKKGKGVAAAAAGGGAEDTRRPQKSRRICHKCQTPFSSRDAPCEKCKHVRCLQCPRDPPKPDTYTQPPPPPTSSANDPQFQPSRWTCHACKRVSPDPDQFCATCGHGKCNDCPRQQQPPEKGKRPAQHEEGGEGTVTEGMGKVEVSQASAA